jgi:cell wall-associated NlpC family hydrolase
MKNRIFLFLLFFCLFVLPVAVLGATTHKSAVIQGYGVNFRAKPNLDGQVISVLQQGLQVAVIEDADQWYKIQLSDGQTGWVNRQFIELKSIAASSEEHFTALPIDELLVFAKSFLEIKYIYGGDSPLGFDCSGFTMYVFAKFGVCLLHEADLQFEAGTEVSDKKDLLPGDLVFFKTDGSEIVNHVGIYLGENQFIGASSGYGAVRINPLDSGYYFDCYVGGRRFRNNNGRDENSGADNINTP